MAADLKHARELFLHALGNLPPDQWDAYAAQACGGDAGLEQQVKHFLKIHCEAGSFLEQPGIPGAGGAVTAPAEVALEAPGTALGPYKLIQQLGEGGMGTVFMAQQTEPVQRLVALKVIKAGMDSRQVIARFEAERQALALMDHPNIAKVFDAGTIEAHGAPSGGLGRPYFVMELVKGVAITRYCDEQRLTPRQRLELFVHVCQAVQHAHQKGIIHRDLKPSNVMVALYDGRPVPKVIDFGIAKAAGQPLTEKTLVTGFGALVGTLEYMSPEQAELNSLDVDTRSDVYSLGVLLYELLTGTTPLERKRVQQTGLLEALRLIREEETPRPSARLSTAEELPRIAAARGIEPRKLTGMLRGEVDWIVMKCLEKDRSRRYETANGLALDVQRYLADEPVQACPPSAGYRLRKFARRNRAALAAVVAAVGVLIAAVVGLAVSNHLIGKKQEETRAALGEATTQRDKAAKERQEAREALDLTTSHFLTAWLGQHQQLSAEQKLFLEKMLVRYEHFTEAGGDTPDDRAALAGAYSRVGDIRFLLGLLAEARVTYGRAIELLQLLVTEHPGESGYVTELAEAHSRRARLHWKLGDHEQALKSYGDARALLAPLVPEQGGVTKHASELATAHSNIGAIQLEIGQSAEALKSYEAAAELINRLIEDKLANDADAHLAATVHNNLGKLYGERGDYEQALAAHAEALSLWEQLVQKYPGVPEYAVGSGHSHYNLAIVHAELEQVDESVKSYERSRDVFAPLARRYPGVPEYSQDLARTLGSLGLVQFQLRHYEPALKSLDAACSLGEALVEIYPEIPEYAAVLGRCRTWRGSTLYKLNKLPEALKSLEAARTLQEPLVEKHPDVREYGVNLGTTYLATGLVVAAENDPDGALKWYDKGIAVLRPVSQGKEALVQAREDFRSCHWNRGYVLLRLSRKEEALKAYEEGLALAEQLFRDYQRPAYAAQAAGRWQEVAALQAELGRTDPALRSYAKACELWGAVVAQGYQLPDTARFQAMAHTEMARFQVKLGKTADAVTSYKAGRRVAEELFKDQGREPYYAFFLANICNNLGIQHMQLGQQDDARAAYERARTLQEALVRDHPDRLEYAVELGGTYCNLGLLLKQSSEAKAALPWFGKAINTLEPLDQRKPPPRLARSFLLNSYWGRAETLRVLGRHAESLMDRDQVLKLDGGRNPSTRLQRAATLAQTGEHAAAAAATDELASLPQVSAPFAYDLACAYALCAAAAGKDDKLSPDERTQAVGKYADRAVELLRRAVRAGYRDVEHLKKDPDLDTLRSREDFKKLVGDLETKLKN